MEEKDAKKKLEEMNLLDDFLFGSVVTYPEVGERFVRKLLRIIFGKEFKHLTVTAQKVFYGADSDLHGARLDVYVEPEIKDGFEGKAAVYDVEPDRTDSAKNSRALPRRVRFYHAKIAMGNLKSGKEYDELKNVVIIMITPYDPFGLDCMMYTVKNRCIEEPEMEYEDGASTLFLYTKGTKRVPSEALKQLLHYMEDSTYENAVNDDLKEIHGMVEGVRKDPEMSIRYLRMLERLRMSEEEGERKTLVTQVCKKVKKNKTVEEIAEDLEEEETVIRPIYDIVVQYAPECDPELVLQEMNKW